MNNASLPADIDGSAVLLLACACGIALLRLRTPRGRVELYLYGALAIASFVANRWLMAGALYLFFAGAAALSADFWWGMLFSIPSILAGSLLWRSYRHLTRSHRATQPITSPVEPTLSPKSVQIEPSEKGNSHFVLSSPILKGYPNLGEMMLLLLLTILFWIFVGVRGWLQDSNTEAFGPLLATLGLFSFSVLFALAFLRITRSLAERRVLTALKSPDPEVLYENAVKGLSPRLAAGDAIRAQERAVAFAIYARPREARGALRTVAWSSKHPLVGSGESFCRAWIALLCDREPFQARSFYEAFQRHSVIHPLLRPKGAENSSRLFLTACSVFADEAPSNASAFLEGVLDSPRIYDRLLARMTLAQVMDDAGRSERAQQLRQEVLAVAPYARGLHLVRADFGSPSFNETPSEDICHSESPATPPPAPQEATRRISVVMVWILVMLLLNVVWLLLAKSGPPKASQDADVHKSIERGAD